jgi:hypothetical protein
MTVNSSQVYKSVQLGVQIGRTLSLSTSKEAHFTVS